MNAADELERMAVEVEQTAKGRALAADRYKGADREQRLLCESNGLYEAVCVLRARAAELRAAVPMAWSGASGSVSVGTGGSLEFRRPDGSKIWDFDEGFSLLIDCTVALLRERGDGSAK